MDTGSVLLPGGEALFPVVGGLGGEGVDVEALGAGVVGVHPGREFFGAEVGEGEEQVREVAFGVDYDGGDAVNGGFLEESDAESGFAGACHADADGVGDEVFGVVEEGEAGVLFFAEVEDAELFVIGEHCSIVLVLS